MMILGRIELQKISDLVRICLFNARLAYCHWFLVAKFLVTARRNVIANTLQFIDDFDIIYNLTPPF